VACTTVIGVVTPLRVTVMASPGAQLAPVRVVVPPRDVVAGVATSAAVTLVGTTRAVAVRWLVRPVAVSVRSPTVAV